MPRRYLMVAVAAVLALGLFVWRDVFREKRDSVPDSPPAIGTRAPAEASSQAARPVFQRPAVRLEVPPSPTGRVEAPNGAFEGRIVSSLTGRGLPAGELTFARAGEASSVSATADGSFRFDARVPGRWLLAAATAPGHLPFAPEWGQSPVLLDARPGEVVREITIALAPAEELEGRVVDPDGRPVEGAEITVLGGRAGAGTLVPTKDRFRSDSAGTFRFTAPEDAIVEALHEGFAKGRARIDYTVRLSRKLTLRLVRRTEARASIHGDVIDPDGSPAEGAVVSATLKKGPLTLPATTRADLEGRFKLQDLEDGTWTLVASRSGAAPGFAEAAAGARGVRIQLPRGGELAGRVRDRRSGAPVAPFTVVAQSKETRSISAIDPAGEYHFSDLSSGPAVVSVFAPGYAPSAEIRVTIPEPGAGPALANFDLNAGGSLTGVVLQAGTRKPIPDARVEVEGASPSTGVRLRNETVTDREGRFTLNGLAENTVGLLAHADGYHARVIAAPAIVERETRGPVTIELNPVKAGEEPRVELAGIGVMLQKNADLFRILGVAPNGGAAEAGLAAGDEVLFIDGSPVKPMTIADAVPLLRGPEGTTVILVIVKAGDARPVTLAVLRRLVRG
jgi:hypothetical protein